MRRIGPVDKYPFGKYKGRKVLDILYDDPQYLIWSIREFLDLSPTQSTTIELELECNIPSRYVVSPKQPTGVFPLKKKKVSPTKVQVDSPTTKDDSPVSIPPYGTPEFWWNYTHIPPNYNFWEEKD